MKGGKYIMAKTIEEAKALLKSLMELQEDNTCRRTTKLIGRKTGGQEGGIKCE